MTREEAIQILSTRDAHGVLCGYTSGVTEALDMAIEALKAKTDGELISRKAAIEAMEQRYCDIERVKKRPVTKGERAIFLDMRGVVRTLPSWRCRMSDLISRQDAIDAVIRECEPICDAYDNVVTEINSLPSAESVHGWIPVSERLPDADDCPMDCMVTRQSQYVGNYTDMAVAEADGTWTYEDWKAITINGNATCISTRDADIIAWMPLPEPYREDGEA